VTGDGKVHSTGHHWGSIYGSVENEVRYVASRKAGHLLRLIARNRCIERLNPKPWGWPVGS
jgi:hypothetical protein